eukprot:1138746-Pelagomonas_calceolata.AAC.4
MPQQCCQGISGSSANHNADCTYTGSDHFYTAATSQNDTPSIPLTNPDTPNSPKTGLQTPIINSLALNCDGNGIWKYREPFVKKLAHETTANHGINAVYYCDYDITLIDA